MRQKYMLAWGLVVAGILVVGLRGWAAEATPKPIPLWPEGPPGSVGKDEGDLATLIPFVAPPDRATGAAVIICPGGGYHHLAEVHQRPVAEWLNQIGVAGFVLRYRHLHFPHPAPFQDAQRAIRLVRARAEQWRLDPNRIGIMGFSAGGHLASMTGTHFDAGRADAADPIERASCRPDLMILAVAVITMRPPHAHTGSVHNLLGKNPPPELVAFCSTDEHVTKQTPPTFIVGSWSDPGVPIENSLRFAAALRKAGVPCEMHLYEQGPHNFLQAQGELRRILDTWWDHLADWLRLHGFAARTQSHHPPQ